MSKREHEHANGTGENGGSRHKRRREGGGSSSDIDVTMSDPIEPPKMNGAISSPELVKEQGMKLLTAVRDAANKEGRVLSLVFVRKPSKRQYPDYYALIKQPIALDDVKKKLDSGEYGSLEGVKSDFELMFSNAKQYNQTESIIFQDAKELMKIVNKTYQKMVPGGEDEENGKPKPPTLHRLMKTRLERLITKKDATGRVLSTEFMFLPSKKEWSIYYKEIKKPQCLDTIQRNIKRKEYQTSAQFASDVELVFANAVAFNQDETQIWNDAMALRNYFRQLMSDMPPPHSLPEYAKLSNKIKIRPPQAAQAVASSSSQQAPKHAQSTSSLLLRVPAAHPPKPASTSRAAPEAPVPPPPTQASTVPTEKPTPPAQPTPARPQRTQVQVQPKAPTPQPPIQTVSFINATPSHYPRAPYAPIPSVPAPLPAVSATPPVFHASSTLNTNSTSQSPAPVVLPPSHQLKSIELRIQPKGRLLTLDHRDGVKSWALRLAPAETSVNVGGIAFIGDQDDEDSSDDDQADKGDDDDFDMDVDVEADSLSPSKNGRKKGKGRGRGRPPKAATAKAAQAKAAKTAKKKPATKIGEVQLKLNNFVVKEQPDQQGEWNVYLHVGSNVIEVGEVGGMIWKIYLERLGDS